MIALKPSPKGSEISLSRRTFIDRYVLNTGGVVVDSQTIDEPTDATLDFDRQGAEFAFLDTDAEGLWLQRIESL